MGKYSVFKLPTDLLKITAQNVAQLRKQNRWTQSELAERSGVSFGSIKRFERTGQISYESLLKIAEVLGRLEAFEAVFEPNDTNKVSDLFNEQK